MTYSQIATFDLSFSWFVIVSVATGPIMQGFNILSDPLDGGAFLLLIMLYFLGARLVNGNAKLQLTGKRIALAAFFLFVFVAAAQDKPSDAGGWVAILFRSLILAGIVLGAVWTVLPALAFAYANTFGALFQMVRSWSRAAQRRSEQHSADRERRRLEAEWERDRPRREQEALNNNKAQQRRDDARAECDALYALAAPEIGTRFSKQDFSEFVSKHMTDAAPPEVVEERAEQLTGIIRQHQEKVTPTPKFQTLQELAAWFEARKAEIETVSDERLRKTLVVQLKQRYSELSTALLSEMSP